MENLDGTILATAAPAIARSFHVASAEISIAITAYLLTLAVFIPATGWLTDRVGVRPVFLTAIVVFTLASLACAAAPSLAVLTALRVVQGLGGAMMVPVGRLAVLRSSEKKDIVRAVAWLTWPALVAPIVAPFVGGLITSYAHWPIIFLLNAPLGVIAFVVALRIVPRIRSERGRPFDWLGFALSCIGLGALATAGAVFSEARPQWIAGTLALAIGVVVTSLAVGHLRRATTPLLDLGSFRRESFRVPHAGGSLFRLTILAMPFLLALFYQDALGWSPVAAGSVVLVLFAGNLAIKVATTALLRRFGFKPVLVASCAGSVACMVLLAFVDQATPVVLMVVLLFASGVARSSGFTVYNTLAFADVPEAEMTDANTLASTVQQVVAGFGVAVGALALRAGEPLAALTGATDAVAAFHVAFLIVALLTAVALVEALRLSRDAGGSIRPASRPSV
ncbi:MFS transporter [Galbitalea soli]|uniref:MFS transporter n=2 Tax=Galbitalea soli TaxID=1268042 RepID=A0A7C9PM06_9MICO|nr:MFS transporter [Galbitalea soli]NEM90526.1 MFS transporter [Galbitalea soli]